MSDSNSAGLYKRPCLGKDPQPLRPAVLDWLRQKGRVRDALKAVSTPPPPTK